MRLMRNVAALAAVVLVVSGTASPLSAQNTQAAPTRLLVLDLAPSDEAHPIANRIFSISETESDPAVTSLRCYLSALRDARDTSTCDSTMPGASPGRGPAGVLRFIRGNGKQLSLRSSARWVSRKGDSLQIFVFHQPDSTAILTIKEVARRSRIATDLRTLAQIALKIGGLRLAENRDIGFSFRQHYLTETRATLTVAGSLGPKSNRGAIASENAAEVSDQLTTSIVTGPREHLFLSAKAALTELRQAKYDSETNTFDLDDKPTAFLIGVNYAVGDLLRDAAPSSLERFANGTFISLLLEGSKTPFDQIGAAIGFRHSPPGLDSFLSLETVSPYVGLIWGRNDRAESETSNRIESTYGRRSIVWGLSLNLDKALGWLGT